MEEVRLQTPSPMSKGLAVRFVLPPYSCDPAVQQPVIYIGSMALESALEITRLSCLQRLNSVRNGPSESGGGVQPRHDVSVEVRWAPVRLFSAKEREEGLIEGSSPSEALMEVGLQHILLPHVDAELPLKDCHVKNCI